MDESACQGLPLSSAQCQSQRGFSVFICAVPSCCLLTQPFPSDKKLSWPGKSSQNTLRGCGSSEPQRASRPNAGRTQTPGLMMRWDDGSSWHFLRATRVLHGRCQAKSSVHSEEGKPQTDESSTVATSHGVQMAHFF